MSRHFGPGPRVRRYLVCAVGLALLCALPPAPRAFAAAINIDCDVNQLVNALDTANTNAGADTLELTSNCTYTLTTVNNTSSEFGPNGLPVIISDITINGSNATIARDASAAAFCLVQINPGAALTLNHLTLSGGDPGASDTKDGWNGGAIYNRGTCNLNHTSVEKSHAGDGIPASFDDYAAGTGGHGGGMYNEGSSALDDTTFRNNRAGSASFADYMQYSSTVGGNGGGIYNLGTLTITNSNFTSNATPHTPGGVRGGAGVGSGGAIYNVGALTLSSTEFTDNRTGNAQGYMLGESGGNGGAIYNNGALVLASSTFSENTTGFKYGGMGDASGGAIFNDSAGQLNLSHSDFTNNHTGSGEFASGVGRNGGDGGGVANAGTAEITDVTFDSNTTGAGGGDIGYGNGGNGAGLYNSGTLEVSGSTFFSNQTGDGGQATYGQGRGGSGAGVYNTGVATISNATFLANMTGNGGKGPPKEGGGDGGGIANQGSLTLLNLTLKKNGVGTQYEPGRGGGIANPGGTTTLENSIIANSVSGNNCSGKFIDNGGNIRFPETDTTCVGAFGAPKLGPLQDNGGATQTIALAPDSAAINKAVDATCPVIDQRGTARPQGKHCDSGAFELEPPTAITLIAPPDGDKTGHAQVNLKWNPAQRIGWYRVIVKQDSTAGAKVVRAKSDTLQFKTPELENGHWYYWRVKACSKVGCTVSPWRRFRIQ